MNIEPVDLTDDDEIMAARKEPWRIEYALALEAAEAEIEGELDAYYELCTEIGMLIQTDPTLSKLDDRGVINADRAGELAEAIYLGAEAKASYGSVDLVKKAKKDGHAAVLLQILAEAEEAA